jgi:hypothetical protein
MLCTTYVWGIWVHVTAFQFVVFIYRTLTVVDITPYVFIVYL